MNKRSSSGLERELLAWRSPLYIKNGSCSAAGIAKWLQIAAMSVVTELVAEPAAVLTPSLKHLTARSSKCLTCSQTLREGWQDPLCQGHCVQRTGSEQSFGGPQRWAGTDSGPRTQTRPSSSHSQERIQSLEKVLMGSDLFPGSKVQDCTHYTSNLPHSLSLPVEWPEASENPGNRTDLNP